MAPRFRADQIGSLLRPPELLEARSSISAPSQLYAKSTDEKLQRIEKECIESVVAKQLVLGIRPVTNGEYSRSIYYGGFFEKLQGMRPIPELRIPDDFRTDFPTVVGLAKMGATTRAAVVCDGPIRWTSSAYLDEWKTLRNTLPQAKWAECKLTMPAPSYQHIQLRTSFTPSSGYASDGDYFKDLATAYIAEIQALYAEGLRNIQIDDPHLTYFCSPLFLNGCKKDGIDSDALLDLYLRSHDWILEPVKRNMPDLHLGVHLCRGNMSGSTHWVTGSYEHIARKLFTATAYDTYYLEFDDVERAGGFETLRFVPKGKNIVLGLVSTKRTELEDKQDLRRKILAAAEVIGRAQGVSTTEALDSLAISPQCGFSSLALAGGRGMSHAIMWDKLGLVRDVARDVWQDTDRTR